MLATMRWFSNNFRNREDAIAVILQITAMSFTVLSRTWCFPYNYGYKCRKTEI